MSVRAYREMACDTVEVEHDRRRADLADNFPHETALAPCAHKVAGVGAIADIDEGRPAVEVWRPGVMWRMRSSSPSLAGDMRMSMVSRGDPHPTDRIDQVDEAGEVDEHVVVDVNAEGP